MGDERKAKDPIPKVPDPPTKEATPPAGAPAPEPAGPDTGGGSKSPLFNAKPLDLSLTPPSLLGKEALGPFGMGGMPRLAITKTGDPADPQGAPADPIDWFGMRQPFLSHGFQLTGRDADQIQLNFYNGVGMLQGLGVPRTTAISLTNLGLAFAYDTQLGLESPNTLEKFDRDTERALGPGKRLGKLVVPVLTPDTLSWAVQKVSGKKLDFHF